MAREATKHIVNKSARRETREVEDREREEAIEKTYGRQVPARAAAGTAGDRITYAIDGGHSRADSAHRAARHTDEQRSGYSLPLISAENWFVHVSI